MIFRFRFANTPPQARFRMEVYLTLILMKAVDATASNHPEEYRTAYHTI